LLERTQTIGSSQARKSRGFTVDRLPRPIRKAEVASARIAPCESTHQRVIRETTSAAIESISSVDPHLRTSLLYSKFRARACSDGLWKFWAV